MRALLDTHVFLWWVMDDCRLSARASELIADPAVGLCFSAASVWEIAIKTALAACIARRSSIYILSS